MLTCGELTEALVTKGTSLSEKWRRAVRARATVCILEVGPRPQKLTYRPLSEKPNRQKLACAELMRQMSDSPDLSHAYVAAHKLMPDNLPDWIKDRRFKRMRVSARRSRTYRRPVRRALQGSHRPN